MSQDQTLRISICTCFINISTIIQCSKQHGIKLIANKFDREYHTHSHNGFFLFFSHSNSSGVSKIRFFSTWDVTSSVDNLDSLNHYSMFFLSVRLLQKNVQTHCTDNISTSVHAYSQYNRSYVSELYVPDWETTVSEYIIKLWCSMVPIPNRIKSPTIVQYFGKKGENKSRHLI